MQIALTENSCFQRNVPKRRPWCVTGGRQSLPTNEIMDQREDVFSAFMA